jgi:secreted PhoX family phosphatase
MKAHGFGELFPTTTSNTKEIYLALPKGFQYNVIGKVNRLMSDGHATPPMHDGMSTFYLRNELRIVRNHEVRNDMLPTPGRSISKSKIYDQSAGGGTTTLLIDEKTREVRRDLVSLSGTLVNCGGGATPWGSWISCEETTIGQTVRTDVKGVKTGGFDKPHGYCFEVPASANEIVEPIPLKAMGRFSHEAAAVDDRSGMVYMTEDNIVMSGFYRFLPKRNRRLTEGGRLQMLAIKGKPEYDTRVGQKVRASFQTTWVTIDRPDPPEADVDENAVFKQGKAKGAATFARLEGCCVDGNGLVYFASTNGGDNKGGQIWLYHPIDRDEGKLTLLFESPDRNLLDMPDNVCVMPGSELLFMCEDSDYVDAGPGTPENFIRILTPSGRIADFAKNITPNFITSEFAGATFSNDGKTLFVNLQAVGATFAIWGNWDNFN